MKAEQVAFTANLGRIKTIKAKNTALTAKLGHIKTGIDKRRVKNAQRAHLRLLVAEFAIVSKIDKDTLLNLYMAAEKTLKNTVQLNLTFFTPEIHILFFLFMGKNIIDFVSHTEKAKTNYSYFFFLLK